MHALLATNGVLYVGGVCFRHGVTQHGLVEVNTSNGSMITTFNAQPCRADIDSNATTGTDVSGEDPICVVCRTQRE